MKCGLKSSVGCGQVIFFNEHQFQVVEKFRRKEPVLGIWRNQNQTTTVLGMWKKIRMKEPLVLVISKTSKNCWVSWKNRKRSDGFWALIWLCQRMRKVVYVTAGHLIFQGQQKKSPFLDPTCKPVGALLRKSRSSTCFRVQAAYTLGRVAELLTLGLSEPPCSSPIFCQAFMLSHHPTLCERDRD